MDKKLWALAIGLVVFVSGCVSENTQRNIPFETISKGENSGYSEKTHLVITDLDEWGTVWAKTFAHSFPIPELPEINFSNEVAIAVYRGNFPTSGFDTEIVEITEFTDNVTISIINTDPPPEALLLQIVTEPYHIVKTERIDKPVIFTEHIEGGTITGVVTGTTEPVTVRAIRDLGLVAETTTDENGHYQLEVPEGIYGLIVISDNLGYIYNDEINGNWNISTINETIIVAVNETTSVDIDLNMESADYVADRIVVRFDLSLSEEEIEMFVKAFNSSIVSQFGSGDEAGYFIDIPDDQTVFAMTRLYQSDPRVVSVDTEKVYPVD